MQKISIFVHKHNGQSNAKLKDSLIALLTDF